MRALIKLALSIFAVIVVSISLSAMGTAQCSCAKPNISALEEYKDATIVFSGEIIDIQKSEKDRQDRYYETVKVAVDNVWKENVDSIVTIKNHVYGCVQGWNIGDQYLIYAYLNDDKSTYSTGCCCSRTGKLDKTQKDVDEFFDAGHARSNVNFPQKEKVISAGWMNSRATNFRQPGYPSDINEPRSAARVEVKIMTDVEGNVTSVDIIRGPVRFHNAALDAARRLKFPPTSLSGVPTKVSGWVSFDFKP
jgi:hypothetical protein